MRTSLLFLLAAMARSQSPEDKAAIKACVDQNIQKHYDTAAELARKFIASAPEKRALAQAYNCLGNAHYGNGNNELALDAFRHFEEIAADLQDFGLRARAVNNMATAMSYLGNFDEALIYYNRALDYFKSSGELAIVARQSRINGMLYFRIGDQDRAGQLFETSLQVARQIGDRVLEQNALESLGLLDKQRNDFPAAVRHLTAALALTGNDSDPRMVDEIRAALGNAYCEVGQYDRCVQMAREDVDRHTALGDRLGMAWGYFHLGYAYRRAGALADALASHRQAMARLQEVGYSPELQWDFQKELGRTLRAMGRNQEALDAFEGSISTLEEMRNHMVPAEEARAASSAFWRPVFEDTIDLLFEMDKSRALKTVELSRARAFLSLLAESKVDLRAGLPAADRQRETTLMARIESIQKDLAAAGMAAPVRRQRASELDAAENDLENLRLEFRRNNPRMAAVAYPKPLGLAEIQAVLPPGTTLIEYSVGDNRSFVWALGRDRLASAVLPGGKEIEAQVTALRKALQAPVSALTARPSQTEVARAAARLYATLLKPVEASLQGANEIVVIPDAALYYVPFEVLPAPGKVGYLLQRFPIAYAASATSFAQFDREAKPTGPKILLALGDPAYTNRQVSASRGFELGALPYSRAEVTGIAALFAPGQSKVFLGSGAHQDALQAEPLDQFRYLHFATHGLLDEAHPGRSGLALTAGPADDGVLRVDRIAGLRLRADVVTLSACNTGLGQLVSGEGMLGMVRAFLYAGAASVNVSLWNVNDAATSALMKEFYRNLTRSVPPPEALRRAQISLIHQENALWHHPHFWAPFVLWLR